MGRLLLSRKKLQKPISLLTRRKVCVRLTITSTKGGEGTLRARASFVWPHYLFKYYSEFLPFQYLRDNRFTCELEVVTPNSLASCLIALAQKLRSLQQKRKFQGVSRVWARQEEHGEKAYLVFTLETHSFTLLTANSPSHARGMVRGVTGEEIINCYRVEVEWFPLVFVEPKRKPQPVQARIF